MQGLEPNMQQEFLVILQDLKAQLGEKAWFSEGWEFAISGLDGFASCQLYRPAWLMGRSDRPVHFESFVGQTQLEQAILPVQLHSHPTFPQHEQFARLFLERSPEIVKDWPGYNLATNPASFQLISTRLPFTKEKLADQLLAEFERVQALGKLLDQIASEVI